MGKASKASNKRAALGPQEIRRSAAKSSSKKKHKQRSREQIDQARHVLDSNAQTLYESSVSTRNAYEHIFKMIGRSTNSHSDRPQDETDHVKALTETIMSL